MQAMAIVAPTPKIPGIQSGAGQAEGGACDAADADFSALLKAQIEGGADIALSLSGGGSADVAAEKLPPAALTQADEVPKALKAEVIADPALQNMLLTPEGFLPFNGVQPTRLDGKQELSALSTSLPAKLQGERGPVAQEILANANLDNAKGKTFLPRQAGTAEIAIGGNFLPSKLAGTNGDALNPPPFSADGQQPPETASTALPLMTSGQMVPAAEAKVASATTIVQPTVGGSGWGDALGQKVVWMAGQQHQVAELHLNPPNLGPLEVRLTVNNDQVSALFVSHHHAVREAIEAAMPRLREMFADSGLMLGNAMVSSDSTPQQQASSGQDGQAGSSPRSDFPLLDGHSVSGGVRGFLPLRADGLGLVDLFA